MEDLFARIGLRFDKFYDNEAVQQDYYKYLYDRGARQRQGSEQIICVTQWNRKAIEKIIEDILSNNSDYSTKFAVKQEDGVNVLVLKRPYRLKPLCYRKVMALEDSYEIISKAHRLTGHKGFKSVYSILKEEWSFAAEFHQALNAVCNICKVINQIEVEKSEPKTDDPIFSSCDTWRLKLINLQEEIPHIEHPKYVLVFEDEQSQFLILRALRDMTVEEVTKQLTNVFFGFGPPKIITADDPEIKEVMDPALANIAKLYPTFEATIDYDGEATVTTDKAIIDTLKDWIEDAEISEYEIDCEIGCHVVQKRLNTRLRFLPAKASSDKHKVFIPNNRFFKNELSYEDIDSEVMVLGDLSLRDLFHSALSTHPAPTKPPRKVKRETRGGKESSSKKLKSK